MYKQFRVAAPFKVAALLAVAFVLAACQQQVGVESGSSTSQGELEFKSTDITGASFAREFSLTDHTGKARTLADFSGKVVIVFFGFTQCPDICPTTMISMKGILEKLSPEQAAKVQVLFITVDPERDSAEVLAQYVPEFDKSFLGLRGDLEATKKVAREFKVYFGKVPGTTEGTYSVDHTSLSYVFDKQGQVRLMVRHGAKLDDVASDVKQLL